MMIYHDILQCHKIESYIKLVMNQYQGVQNKSLNTVATATLKFEVNQIWQCKGVCDILILIDIYIVWLFKMLSILLKSVTINTLSIVSKGKNILYMATSW